MDAPKFRPAVRALLINPLGQILLLQMTEPASQEAFWLTPGGGVEEGESDAVGLRRELYEETGLTDVVIGPAVWVREHTFHWGGQAIRQREHYYWVAIEHFDPHGDFIPDVLEREAMGRYHWWDVDEIARSEENFVPRQLADHLHGLLRDGLPPEPIEIGP